MRVAPILLTVASMMLLTAAATPAATTKPSSSPTVFTSEQHGVSLKYPPELTPAEAPNKGSILYLGTESDGEDDIFRESVHLKVEAAGLGRTVTLERAVKGMEGSMKKHGITVLESEPTEINGRPVWRIGYTHPVKLPKGKETVKAVVYLWLRNGTAYGLDVRATEQTYDKFMAVGGKVVASLQWTDAQDTQKQ